MSIFSIGRFNTASSAPTRAWSWPLTRSAASATVVEEERSRSWWRWNPYRQSAASVTAARVDVSDIENQGRREGYLEGKRDQQRIDARRARRARHPILTLVVFLAAVSAAGFTGLAFEMGSFSAAGAVVDQTTAAWKSDVFGAAGKAVDDSGRAVQHAGQTISTKSQSITHQGG